MFELLFPSRYTDAIAHDRKTSMAHERHLLDMAAMMAGAVGGDAMSTKPSFPKYNVYRMLDGSPYIYFIEFALAGYAKETLSAKMDSGYLVVSSKSATDTDSKADREYIHRGMARRDFCSKFFVGKDIKVLSAKFENGLLTVEMEKMIPEEDKPMPIEIV